MGIHESGRWIFVGFLLCFGLFLLAPTEVNAHCKGKHANAPGCEGPPSEDNGVIRLEATFRDDMADHVRSDGLGSYVDGVKGITVEITKDGDLRFVLGVVNTKKKGSVKRSTVLEFDEPLRDGEPGVSPPDPNLEPQNGVWFRTIFFGGADPTLNFRMMNPGEVAPVRLFFPFSTTLRNGFSLRFDPDSPNPGTSQAGAVQVTAVDTDIPPDGLVDRWVLEPLPNTDSKANLTQKEGGVTTDFGDFRMPFQVRLDRLE